MSQDGGAGVKAKPVSHQLEETNIQLLLSHPGTVEETFHPTDLLDLVGRDWFAVSGHGSLGHDDHIETGASGSLL